MHLTCTGITSRSPPCNRGSAPSRPWPRRTRPPQASAADVSPAAGVGGMTSSPLSLQGARGSAGRPAGAAARRALRRQGQHRRGGLPHYRRLQGLRLQPGGQRARRAAAPRSGWARTPKPHPRLWRLQAVISVSATPSYMVSHVRHLPCSGREFSRALEAVAVHMIFL